MNHLLTRLNKFTGVFFFLIIFPLIPQALANCEEIFGEAHPYCQAIQDSQDDFLKCQIRYNHGLAYIEKDGFLCGAIRYLNIDKKECSQTSWQNSVLKTICLSIEKGFKDPQSCTSPVEKNSKSLFDQNQLCHLGHFVRLTSDPSCLIQPAPISLAANQMDSDLKEIEQALESRSSSMTTREAPLDLAAREKLQKNAETLENALWPLLQKQEGLHLREEDRFHFQRSLFEMLVQIEKNRAKWNRLRTNVEVHGAPDQVLAFHEFNLKLSETSQNLLPVKLYAFDSNDITLDFPSMIIGSGAAKKLSFGVDLLGKNPDGTQRTVINFIESRKRRAIRKEYEIQRTLSTQGPFAKVLKIAPFSKKQGRKDDSVLVSQEYFNQGNLEKFISDATRAGISPRDQLKIAAQVSNQLNVMHQLQYAHRDIKPLNIFVNVDGAGTLRASMGDFGSALKVLDHPTQAPEKEDEFQRTPYFLPPEYVHAQAEDRSLTGEEIKKGDIWALGLSLYFLKNEASVSGCRLTPTASAANVISNLNKLTSYNQLCALCNIFCDPSGNKTTAVPAPGTFDHLIYKMLNPNPTERISQQEVAKQFSIQLAKGPQSPTHEVIYSILGHAEEKSIINQKPQFIKVPAPSWNQKKEIDLAHEIHDIEYARKHGRIFEDQNPSVLAPGIYHYVLTPQGKVTFGRVVDRWGFGVSHLSLAQGGPILVAGELQVSPDGSFQYNLNSEIFTSAAISQHKVSESQLNILTEALFAGHFHLPKVQLIGRKELSPKISPTDEEVDQLCNSGEFIKNHKLICDEFYASMK